MTVSQTAVNQRKGKQQLGVYLLCVQLSVQSRNIRCKANCTNGLSHIMAAWEQKQAVLHYL